MNKLLLTLTFALLTALIGAAPMAWAQDTPEVPQENEPAAHENVQQESETQDTETHDPSHDADNDTAVPHAEQQDENHVASDHDDDHATDNGEDHSHESTSDGHADDSHGTGGEESKVARALNHYLAVGHLFHHVRDAEYFELPKFLGGQWHLPQLFATSKQEPLIGTKDAPIIVGRFTKFMALQLVAGLLLCAAFISLARKTQGGAPPRGRLANMLEAVVLFIRDDIARPAIGTKDATRFLPFLLTIFFFILTLNLFGMVPYLGSATGALAVTAVLAVTTFVLVLGSGMKKMGVLGFWKNQVPHMDLPKAMAVVLIPVIWAIEVFGLFIKHFVLAIRLFANMLGGHLVLAALLGFVGVGAAAGILGLGTIGVAAVIGSIMFNLLELLVAFLQAYIFTFLAALFIGAAQHAH